MAKKKNIEDVSQRGPGVEEVVAASLSTLDPLSVWRSFHDSFTKRNSELANEIMIRMKEYNEFMKNTIFRDLPAVRVMDMVIQLKNQMAKNHSEEVKKADELIEIMAEMKGIRPQEGEG